MPGAAPAASWVSWGAPAPAPPALAGLVLHIAASPLPKTPFPIPFSAPSGRQSGSDQVSGGRREAARLGRGGLVGWLVLDEGSTLEGDWVSELLSGLSGSPGKFRGKGDKSLREAPPGPGPSWSTAVGKLRTPPWCCPLSRRPRLGCLGGDPGAALGGPAAREARNRGAQCPPLSSGSRRAAAPRRPRNQPPGAQACLCSPGRGCAVLRRLPAKLRPGRGSPEGTGTQVPFGSAACVRVRVPSSSPELCELVREGAGFGTTLPHCRGLDLV